MSRRVLALSAYVGLASRLVQCFPLEAGQAGFVGYGLRRAGIAASEQDQLSLFFLEAWSLPLAECGQRGDSATFT